MGQASSSVDENYDQDVEPMPAGKKAFVIAIVTFFALYRLALYFARPVQNIYFCIIGRFGKPYRVWYGQTWTHHAVDEERDNIAAERSC